MMSRSSDTVEGPASGPVDEETEALLAERAGELALSQEMTVAVAESLTGGMIAGADPGPGGAGGRAEDHRPRLSARNEQKRHCRVRRRNAAPAEWGPRPRAGQPPAGLGTPESGLEPCCTSVICWVDDAALGGVALEAVPDITHTPARKPRRRQIAANRTMKRDAS